MIPILYLASSALSLLGNSIAAIVLPLVLLQTTGSILGAGTLALTTALPGFAIGLAAGVVLDRVNRRTVSIASDLISAAAVAALPLTASFTDLTLGWFILFGFLGTFGDIPGLTARDTMLPAVARAADIAPERLIGIGQGIMGIVVVVGPASAGTLLVLLDGIGALWVTAATSALSAVITFCLPRAIGRPVAETGSVRTDPIIAGEPSERPAESTPTGHPHLGPVAELLDGWRHLRTGSPTQWRLILLGIVGMAALVGFQGIILPAHFAFIDEPSGLGFALSGLAVGSILGGGIFAVTGPRVRRQVWLTVGTVGLFLALFGIATIPPQGWLLALVTAAGACLALQGGVSTAILLEKIPDRLRGRILGTQNALVMITGPLAMFATAAIASAAGLIPAALLVTAVGLGVSAAVLGPLLRRPYLLTAEKSRETTEAQEAREAREAHASDAAADSGDAHRAQ